MEVINMTKSKGFRGNSTRHGLNSKGIPNKKVFGSTQVQSDIKLVGCNSHINPKTGKSDLSCVMDKGDKRATFKKVDHVILDGDLKCETVKSKQNIMICSPSTNRPKKRKKPLKSKKKPSKKRKAQKPKKRKMKKQKIKTKSGDSFIIWYPENAKFGRFASTPSRQTFENGEIVQVPKGENVYLGRDVDDFGVNGFSNLTEINNTISHIKRDYAKGAIDRRQLNARLNRLALVVKRSQRGSMAMKIQKRRAIRNINKARKKHNLKKLPVSSYV